MFRASKLSPLPVNRPWALDRHILRVHGKDEADVAVAKGCISVEGDGASRVVLLAVGTAKQLALRGNMERNVALHLHCSDDEYTRGHENRSAQVLIARINRRLHRGCIQRLAITFCAEIADVVSARSEVCARCW